MNLNFELKNIIAQRTDKQVFKEGEYAIKVFDENYSKSDILNEALNQARVEETGLNIPKIAAVTVINGKWSIVYDFIEGTPLDKLMAKNPSKLDEYMNLFVDLQLKMHEAKAPMLNKLRDKMHRKISQAASVGLAATSRYELHMRLDGMPKHTKLCHGDFNPSNIIIREDATAFILDWAHATQGNASADAARTYMLFCIAGQEDVAHKYMDLFCQKSDTAKQYVQQWLPIVAASQLVKEHPEEREFLLNWTNIADYE